MNQFFFVSPSRDTTSRYTGRIMDELMDTQESQKVYVVGGQHLQNALLTEFLDKASITASAVKSVDQVHEDDLRAVEQNLFLVDFRMTARRGC